MTLLFRGFIASKLIPRLSLPPHLKARDWPGEAERKFEQRSISNQVRMILSEEGFNIGDINEHRL